MCILTPLFCVLLLLAGDEPDQWKESSPPDGSYSVMLPGSPTEPSTAGARENEHAVRAETAAAGGLVFLIISDELPKKVTRTEYAQEIARGMERGFVRRYMVTVINSEDTVLNDVPGRGLTASGFNGRFVRWEAYAKGAKVYQIMAASVDERSLQAEEAKRFFASFRFHGSPTQSTTEQDREYELGYAIGTILVDLFVGASVIIGIIVILKHLRQTPKRKPVS